MSQTVLVTRRVHFSGAHRLNQPRLSDEENRKLYGLCNNPNYHGHNYELDVTVSGTIDPLTGYVADLGEIKRIVEERVMAKLDHRNFNLDVPELNGVIPSTENVVVMIWRLLEGHLPGRLTRIVLWETPRNYVEYTGGSAP